ncbi:hypothetical protein EYW49_15960 [Siculibacillus lacustris]|uniref:Uncharacterized protein n=1 Tax=Siculibacillus lacustris TaxID=1549641 RepID=A0A4Q9VK55_9HYPH|nr:dimethylsulfonioproprionate lyase family protein [Siculibacillus lacustris]TBW35519.1 hypothetical protein EYW49_15960 [Siculibacillus lacustris]
MTAIVAADDLRRLLAALRRRVAPRPGEAPTIAAERHRVAAALDRLDGRVTPQPATGHPLTRFLPAALALAAELDPDLAAALTVVGDGLPWRYGYDRRADRAGLESSMGWAEIVGPLAPFVSDEVCLGLTLIGPETDYPAHRHPAVELYDVVTGHPVWHVADAVLRPEPGEAILHGRGVVHAMRARAEPLLAVYSWTGDVVSPSVWADD